MADVQITVKWQDEIIDDHIQAACEYLSLQFKQDKVDEARHKFKDHRKDLERHKAKDVIRASGLAVLPPTDSEVADHLAKIKAGKPLHPIALVTDKEKLYVADGFHRVCACYHIADDTDVAGVHIHI
ncbi:MAG TPA: hypothetical protein VEW28_06615 [Candidatus Kapabacteria bacterium]|nr:hypothetical protein [Candidatus Kapabacteria bacterium]